MNEFREWLYQWCGARPEVKIDDSGVMYAVVNGWIAIWDGESVVVG